MKNRLLIAKELLAEDGSIYVQLDYNEIHYAKFYSTKFLVVSYSNTNYMEAHIF